MKFLGIILGILVLIYTYGFAEYATEILDKPKHYDLSDYKGSVLIEKDSFIFKTITLKVNDAKSSDSIVNLYCYDIAFQKYKTGDTIK